ncbi:dihydrofolate reductase family protein [Winogradskyella sp.]|uniref:dihydrofolate reductase family protein n=1 Tax=Winogradskyella sp. TaxID=1883156 RepID=UPI003BA9877A
MRDLAILTFQSLDGVMQAPSDPSEDTSDEFTKGGWAKPYWNQVMEQVMREAMAEPYDLLLGRKTYEIFASHFPNADKNNPVAQRLNKAIKYVVASNESPINWENSVNIKGDVISEIQKLKNKEGPLLQVHGSWELIQELLQYNLIDQLRLWTFPVIVGSGKRLFAKDLSLKSLSLIKSEICDNGAIMSIYNLNGSD